MRQIFHQVLWAALTATASVAGAILASPALAATFVYVSNAESNDIYVLRLNQQTGELTLVETILIPGIIKSGGSTPMAVSPDRRFLYVATRGEPQGVASFAIDPKSGKLKHIGGGPLSDSMAYITTDRGGRFLFAASYPGHKITVSPIGPQNVIQPTRQVLPNHTNAHAILADAKNRYVLATTLGNDLINVFRFDAATGNLEPNTPPSVSLKEKTGPRHFVFHPNGSSCMSSANSMRRFTSLTTMATMADSRKNNPPALCRRALRASQPPQTCTSRLTASSFTARSEPPVRSPGSGLIKQMEP